jgi:hypothetical protein
MPGDVQTPHGVPKALLRDACADLLPQAIVERRWKADFSALVNDGVRDDYDHIVATIECARSAVDSGYVTAGAVTRGAAPRLPDDRSDCRASWALKDLVGLELWLREFAGGR